MIETGKFPDELKEAHVTLIHKKSYKQKRRIIAPSVFCQYSQRYSKDYYISKYPIISTTFFLITNVALEKASTRKTAIYLLSRLGKQPTTRKRPLAHCC